MSRISHKVYVIISLAVSEKLFLAAFLCLCLMAYVLLGDFMFFVVFSFLV